MSTIRAKDRDAVIQSLRAGVVPRAWQHLIQVGRSREIATALADIQRLSDGGASFRLLIGEYGSGKTFLLNLLRSIALERRLVTVHADLNPDRRLQASGGQARSLYSELAKNMATRTKPDGSALNGIVEKFIAQAKAEASAQGTTTEKVIRLRLDALSEMVGGYDFAEVIACYCRGAESGDEQLMANAIRWLRGEFTTKTDARAALGVRTIVDDAAMYDQLKLLARFVRLSGFSGLLVCLDELVNLYKMASPQARNANYEQILRILNDALQGSCEGLGFVLGGTPEFLMDTRRGLYSYPALQSRLAENQFAQGELVDYSGPIIRLSSLTPEDFYVLLHKIRDVYASGNTDQYLLPDDALKAFMAHCESRLGNAYFRTPRTTITAFINLLAVLEQNPGAEWQALLGATVVTHDHAASLDNATDEDDELVSFQLS